MNSCSELRKGMSTTQVPKVDCYEDERVYWYSPLSAPPLLIFIETSQLLKLCHVGCFKLQGHPWVRIDGVAPDKPSDSAVLSLLTQLFAMNKLKKMALMVIAKSLSQEEIAGLKEMSKMIDTDNNGNITSDELKIGLKKFGSNLSETEIQDLMKAADVDNSGTIDYGEFIAAMFNVNKDEKEDYLSNAFSYFDKDGSGYITTDKLPKACEEFRIKDVRLEEIIQEVDQDNMLIHKDEKLGAKTLLGVQFGVHELFWLKFKEVEKMQLQMVRYAMKTLMKRIDDATDENGWK